LSDISKNSKDEIIIRKILWKKGMRYRIHYGPYKIDIAFPRKKIAIFYDSCFWHSCPSHGKIPENNNMFWKNKLYKNWERDRQVDGELKKLGWTVIRIWEHDLKEGANEIMDSVIHTIENSL
jgi:DNA mismatch endonuclease (patch repair protein)